MAGTRSLARGRSWCPSGVAQNVGMVRPGVAGRVGSGVSSPLVGGGRPRAVIVAPGQARWAGGVVDPAFIRPSRADALTADREWIRVKPSASPAVYEPDRLVRVGDLVGAAEVAVRLGLKHPQSVSLLKRRHAEFPEPVMQLAKAFVWNWPDIEAWAKATGRLPD